MQPAFAMQHDMETRLLMTRRRRLPTSTILADMKQRAFEFETGKQPVGNFFDVKGHDGIGIVQRSIAIRTRPAETMQRTCCWNLIPFRRVSFDRPQPTPFRLSNRFA